jgi:hypothetical protein
MKIAALISVFLLLLIFLTVVRVHPQGKQFSISQHAASKGWTSWIFGLALMFFGGFFIIFLETWLYPFLAMPQIFFLVFPFAWICLLMTAWIPDTVYGWKSKIHQITAAGLAWIMVIITGSFAFAGHISEVFRVVAIITALWYIYTLYLFYFVKSSLRHFLVYQSINTFSFFAIIFIISFLQH